MINASEAIGNFCRSRMFVVEAGIKLLNRARFIRDDEGTNAGAPMG